MPYYNQVDDSPKAFILWKNSDHESIGGINFKNIFIEWGKGKDNIIRIRKLHYPKEFYNIVEVMKIADKTVNCPYCKVGDKLTPIPTSEFDKYLNSNDGVNNNMGILDKLKLDSPNQMLESALGGSDKILGSLGMSPAVASDITTTVVPQFVAKIPQALTGYIGSTLGRKVVDGAIGIAGLIALFKYQKALPSKLHDAGLSFFGNFLSNIANTDKGQVFSMNNDLEKLKNSISFGDGKGVMDAFIDPQGLEKLRNQLKIPTTFALPKMNFGKFNLGKKLEPAKVTQLPNAQKMVPSGSTSPLIPFRFNKV